LSLLQLAGRVGRRFDVAFIDPAGLHDVAWLIKEVRNDAAIAQTRIILLESRLAPADEGAEDPTGDIERLLKPVRQSALYDCLSSTIHAKSASVETTAPATPQVQTIAARVLIAEDNAVNREVAGEALRQLGCDVDSANDGQQAIAGWEATRYDVILMDCHMPNMDGIEAAKIIRVREATEGRPRTPILALTANARGEDYERCMAAGMDDYLTKPLTLDELRVALDRWVGRKAAPKEPMSDAGVETAPPIAAADPPPADVTVNGVEPMSNGASILPKTPATPAESPAAAPNPPAENAAVAAAAAAIADSAAAAVSGEPRVEVGDALDKTTIDYLKSLRRGDGPSVLERAVGMYLENAPTVLEELRRAIAGGDASAVWKIAHSLKSSSASLGAKQLAQHIGDMEGRARQNDLVEADSRLVRIETEFQKVSSALRETLREEKKKCRQTA
jgi:CheY-like chemotaxis protein/HPt (histidine-containing phosphotransfer) domain-containing protein